MASITLRNLDDGLIRRLRTRAAEHGRPVEEEAREILRFVVGEEKPPPPSGNLVEEIRFHLAAFFNEFGGVDLEIPPREPVREPPKFD